MVERRGALTSNVLAQLKSIKAMGLCGSLLSHLEEERAVEMKASLRERQSVLWFFLCCKFSLSCSLMREFSSAWNAC